MAHKSAKLIAGAVFLSLGLYVIVSEGFSVISNDAVINVRIATVRAPIDGHLELKQYAIGQRVQERESFGSVLDDRADDARIRDLERNADALEAENSLIKEKLKNIVDSKIDLGNKSFA